MGEPVFMGGKHEKWERLTRSISDIEAALAHNLEFSHGLGLNEYRALKHLSAASNSELRMQDLAQKLGLKQSSISRMTDKLEKMGLTVRDTCPNDKKGCIALLQN